MSGTLRKGWCPGALRPMMAKDGLLVRLRITGGIVPAATAKALARLAVQHGNGTFDLSARGNLQMRGVAPDRLPALHGGLRALGLIDTDAAAEAVRNVIASPLAGLHAGLDIRPIVALLEARLTADAGLHALPTKFGFLIDDGSLPSLADVAADIRFDWIADQRCFAAGLGGTRCQAMRAGTCRPDELVDMAARLALGALGLMTAHPKARRCRMLIETAGAAAVSRACRIGRLDEVRPVAAEAAPPALVGHCRANGGAVLGLAAPFGRLDHAMLTRAATLAAGVPASEIRLTPWRTLLVPIGDTRIGDTLIGDTWIDDPLLEGFIVDAGDPRLGIEACVGTDGCDRGTTPTRRDAMALAALRRPSRALHVSGCEKGCAKASSSDVTLVGRDGRYDLVRDGRAGDPPVLRNLDLAAACDAIMSPMEPA